MSEPRMELILASASPRREEILRRAGFVFEVRPAEIDESRHANESPVEYVRRLALTKARAVAQPQAAQETALPAIVIGADTVVSLGEIIYGKPASLEAARETLSSLSGATHEVFTGIAVIRFPGGFERATHEITRVTFARLSAQQIEDYLASGEGFGKAGAYAIQGLAGRFVEKLDGDYFNVMGLPLARLRKLLEEAGWSASQNDTKS